MEGPTTPDSIVSSYVECVMETVENVTANHQPKTRKGERVRRKPPKNKPSQPDDAHHPIVASSPKVNYKSLCRQLKQKNQQLGKAYQDLKGQLHGLQQVCEEKEAELEQSQQDAEEMARFVRSVEEKMAAYKKCIGEQQQ